MNVQAQIDQAPLNPDTTNEEVGAIERNAAKVSGVKAIEATTTAQDLERVKTKKYSKLRILRTQLKLKWMLIKKLNKLLQQSSNATDEVAEANARRCSSNRRFT